METLVKNLIKESIRKNLLALGAPENHLLNIMTEKAMTCIMALAYNDSDVRAAAQDLWEIPTQTIGNTPSDIVLMLDGILKKFPNEIDAYIHYLAHKEDEFDLTIEKINEILER